MNHTHWNLPRERELSQGRDGLVEPPEIVAEREQIRLALELGQLVHDRRTALGLTEAALGERLGMSADEVEAIELGGVLPVTSALLARLAAALDGAVDLHLVPEGRTTVSFERARGVMKPEAPGSSCGWRLLGTRSTR